MPAHLIVITPKMIAAIAKLDAEIKQWQIEDKERKAQ